MICDRCGATLVVGEWPFCPHGFGVKGLTIIPDGIPGGETIENLSSQPITFYSRSEKRDYLRAHGIREKVQHVGLKGSDKNPHTQRWV